MSTITGNILDLTGAFATGDVITFTPLSTPTVIGGSIIKSKQKTATVDSSGNFSIVLKAGDYRVQIADLKKDRFLISVPDDSASYSIIALITTALVYTYTFAPGYVGLAPSAANFRFQNGNAFQLFNITTGLWHSVFIEGATGLEQITLGPGVA